VEYAGEGIYATIAEIATAEKINEYWAATGAAATRPLDETVPGGLKGPRKSAVKRLEPNLSTIGATLPDQKPN
jgi:hypothetical protein